jgi:hypothetical protein
VDYWKVDRGGSTEVRDRVKVHCYTGFDDRTSKKEEVIGDIRRIIGRRPGPLLQ